MWTQIGALPSDKSFFFYSPLPGTGEGRRGTSRRKDRVLPLSRHEEGKKLFLCLRFSFAFGSTQSSHQRGTF